jgi:hypothetical protein
VLEGSEGGRGRRKGAWYGSTAFSMRPGGERATPRYSNSATEKHSSGEERRSTQRISAAVEHNVIPGGLVAAPRRRARESEFYGIGFRRTKGSAHGTASGRRQRSVRLDVAPSTIRRF